MKILVTGGAGYIGSISPNAHTGAGCAPGALFYGHS